MKQSAQLEDRLTIFFRQTLDLQSNKLLEHRGDIASYLGHLCDDLSHQGCRQVTIILDNNSTHKDKMKSQLDTLMSALDIKDKIQVEFIHTPPYSPDFNLVVSVEPE